MHKYYEILYQYGSVIVCATSVILLIQYAIGILRLKELKIIIYIVFIAGTLITLEFYPVQISIFFLNVIFPITYAVMLFQLFYKNIKTISFVIFGIHSIILILGLTFLSSSANTWGDGAATFGVFMTPVSALIILYQFTKVENLTFIGIGKISTGFLSFILMLISTKGFSVGEFDGGDVYIRRIVACSCSIITIIEGFIIIIWRTRINEFLRTSSN